MKNDNNNHQMSYFAYNHFRLRHAAKSSFQVFSVLLKKSFINNHNHSFSDESSQL